MSREHTGQYESQLGEQGRPGGRSAHLAWRPFRSRSGNPKHEWLPGNTASLEIKSPPRQLKSTRAHNNSHQGVESRPGPPRAPGILHGLNPATPSPPGGHPGVRGGQIATVPPRVRAASPGPASGPPSFSPQAQALLRDTAPVPRKKEKEKLQPGRPVAGFTAGSPISRRPQESEVAHAAETLGGGLNSFQRKEQMGGSSSPRPRKAGSELAGRGSSPPAPLRLRVQSLGRNRHRNHRGASSPRASRF